MPKFHLQAPWNIICYLFSSAVFFKVNHHSEWILSSWSICALILFQSAFTYMLHCCISRIFYLVATLNCIFYVLLISHFLNNIENWGGGESKPNLFQRMRQALHSPGSPGLEGSCQSIPISQICIFSDELHCSFAVKKSHCGTLKISSILSTIISLSILLCLSVGAGAIWFWE